MRRRFTHVHSISWQHANTLVVFSQFHTQEGRAVAAGHLYRNLAPNPRATQWAERILKLSATFGDHGKLSKSHFTSASVKDWCIVAAWYHGTPEPNYTKFKGPKFRWTRPLPNFVALQQKVWDIYIGWQWRNFFISYLCQLFFRHVVGHALQSVSYSTSLSLYDSAYTAIFLNQLIQFYSTNAINLHHLTTHSTTVLTYKMAIVLRP